MVKKLIDLAKKANMALEVCSKKEYSAQIEVLNSNLKNFYVASTTRYQIKAIKDGKCCFFTTEDLSNPDYIIKELDKAFLLSDNDNINRLSNNSYELRKESLIKPDFKKVKEDLLSLDSLREEYPYIKNIEASYAYNYMDINIENTNNFMEDSNYNNYIMVSVSGVKDNVVKSDYISIYTKYYDFETIKNKVRELVQYIAAKFAETSISTNKYNVLLKNNVVKDILTTFIPAFSTRNINMKLSFLTDKLNQKVFSDKISIVEEPLNAEFVSTRAFDDEGTLTYNKEYVLNGVFKKTYNSLEYALKNKEKPTGNSYGVRNFHLVAGNKSYAQLINTMENGIIINRIEGMHSGINMRSGDISLQATGLLVEQGKVTKTLNMIILQSNILEILNNVLEVGNDLEEFNSTISSPSLLLHDITICGSL